MKKRISAAVLALCLLLSSCACPEREEGSDLRVLCTTYPVYLFATALTQGADGLRVSLLVNAQTSCLHDYTLTVKDMKAIESAHVIVMNGAGLEDFMAGALSHSRARTVDLSAGIALLPAPDHGAHSHEDEDHPEYDPHIWMDPHRAGQMLDNLAAALEDLDPDRAQIYDANLAAARKALEQLDPPSRDTDLPPYPLITFHDGFQYFAHSQGFRLVKAIEEEEGSTVSAAEIREVSRLVKEQDIPAVFTERSGPAAAAGVISRETGCALYQLDLLMSGTGFGLQPYLDCMQANLNTVRSAFEGREDHP